MPTAERFTTSLNTTPFLKDKNVKQRPRREKGSECSLNINFLLFRQFDLSELRQVERLMLCFSTVVKPKIYFHFQNTAKKSFQERNIQRSRSYSADSMKGKNRIYSNVQDGKYSVSSSEDDKWYSEDWPQQEIRCRPRFPSPVCYSPQPARRRGWCAN